MKTISKNLLSIMVILLCIMLFCIGAVFIQMGYENQDNPFSWLIMVFGGCAIIGSILGFISMIQNILSKD